MQRKNVLFIVGARAGGNFLFFFAHSLHVSREVCTQSLAVSAAHKACLEPFQTC